MEAAVQSFVVLNLLVIGLSHVLASSAWVDFFLWLREKREAGVLVVGSMSLVFGSIIVALRPTGHGLGLVVPILGWAHVAKALLYLVFPRFGLRQLARVSPERAHHFVIAGVALFGVAGAVGWELLAIT